MGCDDQIICNWQPLFFSPSFHFLFNPKRTQKNPYCCSKRVEKVYLFVMKLSPMGLVCEGGVSELFTDSCCGDSAQKIVPRPRRLWGRQSSFTTASYYLISLNEIMNGSLNVGLFDIRAELWVSCKLCTMEDSHQGLLAP